MRDEFQSVAAGVLERSDSTVEANVDAVAAIYQKAFNLPKVGADDDFFELGGDSLLAETVMIGVEREFGLSLPASQLLEFPTPRLLARSLTSALAGLPTRCLITVRGDGDAPPLVCVHGTAGTSSFPRYLARNISVRRPVYAVRALGLRRGEQPLATLEAAAAAYLSEVKAVHPNGPYFVLGQCNSALLAVEVAHQLGDFGEEVAGLILVDPAVDKRWSPWRKQRGLRLLVTQMSSRRQARRRSRKIADNPQFTPEKRRKAVRTQLGNLIASTSPRRFDGQTLLLCSRKRCRKLLNEKTGWPRYFRELETVVIGETHHELFHECRSETTSVINAFLERVAPLKPHS